MNTLRSLAGTALAIATLCVLGCSSSPSSGSSSSSSSSGSSGSGSSSAQYSLTGVAASGDPLAGAAVTLKDQNGNTQTATTASNGSFSVNVTGLTAPFLLQVVSADGTTTYYSASASAASSNPTANIDQYTDLAVRAYFAALNGGNVSTLFSSVSAATVLPAQADLNNLAIALNAALQITLSADGVASPSSFDIFDTVFAANGTGFDALLHDTTYTSASSPSATASYSISTPGANSEVLTQSGTLTISTGQINLSSTTTNQTNGTTTASTSTFDTIGVTASTTQQQTDEQAALTGIQTLWSNLVATAQSEGSALSASDLAPYFDANFLQNGVNAAQFESYLANQLMVYLSGAQATGSINQVYAFSAPAGGPIQITAQTLLNVSTSGGAYVVDMSKNEGVVGSGEEGWGYIQESDGSYALYGNQNPAIADFVVETSNEYSNTASGVSSATQLELVGLVPFTTPYEGTGTGNPAVSMITIANTGTNAELPSCNPTYALGAAPITLSQYLIDDNAEPSTNTYGIEDALFLPTGLSCEPGLDVFPSPNPPPPAGTPYLVTYTDTSSGATQSSTLFMNSQSSESLQLTANPVYPFSATALAGTPLPLSWPLPTTFALQSISVSVETFGSTCAVLSLTTNRLSPTATSDTVTLPASGTAFAISIEFNGADGELVFDEIDIFGSAPDAACL